jgi:hypothetical protein
MGLDDAEVLIQPNNGYGDPRLLRQLMEQRKIDAIFLILTHVILSGYFKLRMK